MSPVPGPLQASLQFFPRVRCVSLSPAPHIKSPDSLPVVAFACILSAAPHFTALGLTPLVPGPAPTLICSHPSPGLGPSWLNRPNVATRWRKRDAQRNSGSWVGDVVLKAAEAPRPGQTERWAKVPI